MPLDIDVVKAEIRYLNTQVGPWLKTNPGIEKISPNLNYVIDHIAESHPFVLGDETDFDQLTEMSHEKFSQINDQAEMLTYLFDIKLPYDFCMFHDLHEIMVVRKTPDNISMLLFQLTDAPLFLLAISYNQDGSWSHAVGTRKDGTPLVDTSNSDAIYKGAVLLLYLAMVSAFQETFSVTEVVEHPASVQASRAKHHKPLLNDIRVIRARVVYPEKSPEGTHASPTPHDRRGGWCFRKKSGKTYWRREAKVLGGSKTPVINIVKPISEEESDHE